MKRQPYLPRREHELMMRFLPKKLDSVAGTLTTNTTKWPPLPGPPSSLFRGNLSPIQRDTSFVCIGSSKAMMDKSSKEIGCIGQVPKRNVSLCSHATSHSFFLVFLTSLNCHTDKCKLRECNKRVTWLAKCIFFVSLLITVTK